MLFIFYYRWNERKKKQFKYLKDVIILHNFEHGYIIKLNERMTRSRDNLTFLMDGQGFWKTGRIKMHVQLKMFLLKRYLGVEQETVILIDGSQENENIINLFQREPSKETINVHWIKEFDCSK